MNNKYNGVFIFFKFRGYNTTLYECSQGKPSFVSPCQAPQCSPKENIEIIFISQENKTHYSPWGQSLCTYYGARVKPVTADIKMSDDDLPFVIFKFFALAALIVLRRNIPASAACTSKKNYTDVWDKCIKNTGPISNLQTRITGQDQVSLNS